MCFFAKRGDEGKPSAYAAQLRPARVSDVPIDVPRARQSVQSSVMPCVDPETSAR